MNADIFKYKKANEKKLLLYGFKAVDESFLYETDILDNQFKLLVRVVDMQFAETQIIDYATDEEYVLHRVEGSVGGFVGEVRMAEEAVLKNISEECFEEFVFTNSQTRRVIDYVKEKYSIDPEFLWEKTPRNAIFRRSDNKKWFAAVLTVKRKVLGFEGDGVEEILDIRGDRYFIQEVIDWNRYLPAYHMNKTHWFTVLLDETLTDNEIFKIIDESFILAGKK